MVAFTQFSGATTEAQLKAALASGAQSVEIPDGKTVYLDSTDPKVTLPTTLRRLVIGRGAGQLPAIWKRATQQSHVLHYPQRNQWGDLEIDWRGEVWGNVPAGTTTNVIAGAGLYLGPDDLGTLAEGRGPAAGSLGRVWVHGGGVARYIADYGAVTSFCQPEVEDLRVRDCANGIKESNCIGARFRRNSMGRSIGRERSLSDTQMACFRIVETSYSRDDQHSTDSVWEHNTAEDIDTMPVFSVAAHSGLTIRGNTGARCLEMVSLVAVNIEGPLAWRARLANVTITGNTWTSCEGPSPDPNAVRINAFLRVGGHREAFARNVWSYGNSLSGVGRATGCSATAAYYLSGNTSGVHLGVDNVQDVQPFTHLVYSQGENYGFAADARKWSAPASSMAVFDETGRLAGRIDRPVWDCGTAWGGAVGYGGDPRQLVIAGPTATNPVMLGFYEPNGSAYRPQVV